MRRTATRNNIIKKRKKKRVEITYNMPVYMIWSWSTFCMRCYEQPSTAPRCVIIKARVNFTCSCRAVRAWQITIRLLLLLYLFPFLGVVYSELLHLRRPAKWWEPSSHVQAQKPLISKLVLSVHDILLFHDNQVDHRVSLLEKMRRK